MMRTEDDVRQALRERERDAASAADVLPRLYFDEPSRRPGRGRTYLLAAAACAVVGVVVAAMLIVGRHGQRSGTTPSPTPTPTPTPKVTSSLKMPLGPKFEFSFEMGPLPAGYVALNQQIGGIELRGMHLRGATPQWAEIACPIQGTAASCESGRSGNAAADHYVLAAVVGAFDKGQFDPSVGPAALIALLCRSASATCPPASTNAAASPSAWLRTAHSSASAPGRPAPTTTPYTSPLRRTPQGRLATRSRSLSMGGPPGTHPASRL